MLTVSNRRHSACKADALPTELSTPNVTGCQFKASRSALPGRNFANLAALILSAAPVRGFRPTRAARLPTANVPKPTSETELPFFKVVRIAPMTDSSARAAAAFEMSALIAMCSTSSVLFTKNPQYGNRVNRTSLQNLAAALLPGMPVANEFRCWLASGFEAARTQILVGFAVCARSIQAEFAVGQTITNRCKLHHDQSAAAIDIPTSRVAALPPRSGVRGAPLWGSNTFSIAARTASCAFL